MSEPAEITAEQVLAELDEPQALGDISHHWQEAQKYFPGENPEYIQPNVIRDRMTFCGFDEADIQTTLAAAVRISVKPALIRLSWYLIWRVFHGPDNEKYLGSWPMLEKSLGELAGGFFLICALQVVPEMQAWHRKLGLPESTTQETCKQVYCMSGNYRRTHKGRCGMLARQWPWLRNYIAKNLYFRLGRLEFWIEAFSGVVEAYRDRQTGGVIALAKDGTRYDSQGRVIKGETKPADEWTAALKKTEDAVCGYPITPDGRIVKKGIRLPLQRWSPALQAGDAILSVHIPAGGNMAVDACRDSLSRAVEFFSRHFPYIKPRAAYSISWIFHPGLDKFLSPDSNMLKLQKELYLFPFPTAPLDGIWFVFCQDKFDPATAPRDSSMQRAILDRMAAGVEWPGHGGMFFLLDDLPRFGSRTYGGSADLIAALQT